MGSMRYWAICLLFLSSCYHDDPWRNLSIKTGSSSFNSSKLIYPATHFLHDLELEFLYTQETLSAYINVYAETIPSYEGDDRAALLIMEVSGKTQKLVVDRLSGGQKLKIPDMHLSSFVNTFKNHPSVILRLGEDYKTKINTKEFKKHFEKLHIQPFVFISNNPIGLAL